MSSSTVLSIHRALRSSSSSSSLSLCNVHTACSRSGTATRRVLCGSSMRFCDVNGWRRCRRCRHLLADCMRSHLNVRPIMQYSWCSCRNMSHVAAMAVRSDQTEAQTHSSTHLVKAGGRFLKLVEVHFVVDGFLIVVFCLFLTRHFLDTHQFRL